MRLCTVWVCTGMVALITMGTVQADNTDTWDWNGFYVGLHAGYGFGNQSASIGGTPGIKEAIELGSVPRKLDTDPDGFLGGIQIGANRQLDNLVIGLEADASLSSISGSDSATLAPLGSSFTTRAEQDLDWFGTARLRVGIVFGRFLVYGTGGLALGRSDLSLRLVYADGPVTLLRGSEKETSAGWTVGAGVEYALTETVSLKGEYLYYDLGSEKITASDVTDPDSWFILDDTATAKFDINGNIVRAGVNVRF